MVAGSSLGGGSAGSGYVCRTASQELVDEPSQGVSRMSSHTRYASVPPIVAVFLLAASLVFLPPLPTAEASAPIPAGFPNGNNTGLTNPSALKVHNGDLIVTTPGAVIQNLEIRGMVDIQAKNVVMRNVWVWNPSFWTILVRPEGSLLIEDSEIGHPSHPGERGLGGENVTARRLNIHSVEDGIKAGHNSVYDFIYCHDLDSPLAGPHADCFQDDGGSRNFVIRNSTLDARFPNGKSGNAAIIIKSDLGWTKGATVEGNFVNGGAYIMMVDKGANFPAPANVVIRDNAFGSDFVFPPGVLLRHPDADITWQNNYWAATGQIIDMDGNPSGGTATRFSDVSTKNVFYSDIEWLADQGITKGCNPPANTRFCPFDTVTRDTMAAFIARAMRLPAAKKDHFSDDNGSTFEEDINRIADAGIVKGCNPPANTKYCPNRGIDRGQLAAFLVRAKGYTNDGGGDLFIDDDGSVFESDIDKLGTARITYGCNPPKNDRFCPGDYVTRGQLSAFLHRAFG
jgi:hypothetical protein